MEHPCISISTYVGAHWTDLLVSKFAHSQAIRLNFHIATITSLAPLSELINYCCSVHNTTPDYGSGGDMPWEHKIFLIQNALWACNLLLS
jgi:hypothetical protein